MQRSRLTRLVVAAAAGIAMVTVAVPADAHTTGIHDNCTNLNKKWPHGVGTRHAHDRTSGVPVTTFYRSNSAYWAAENHNGTLDRDNDRIACEKR